MLSADAILNNLPGDKSAIRRYVTGAASTALADGMVAVNVTHSNLRQLVQELRFGASAVRRFPRRSSLTISSLLIVVFSPRERSPHVHCGCEAKAVHFQRLDAGTDGASFKRLEWEPTCANAG